MAKNERSVTKRKYSSMVTLGAAEEGNPPSSVARAWNSDFSVSVNLAMNGLEMGKLVLEIEKRKVILDQLPIQRLILTACVAQQSVDVGPVRDAAGRVIGECLNFQTNQVFDMNHRHRPAIPPWKSLGAVEHSKCWTAERVEDVNPSGLRWITLVLRDIIRSENPVIPMFLKDRIGGFQVFPKKDEIDIERRPLHTAKSHRHASNQCKACSGRLKRRDDFAKHQVEVHGGRTLKLAKRKWESGEEKD